LDSAVLQSSILGIDPESISNPLKDELSTLFPNDIDSVLTSDSFLANKNTQSTLIAIVHEKLVSSLILSAESTRDKNLMSIHSLPHAGAHLTMLPLPHRTFTDGQFMIMFRRRLGLPLADCERNCSYCNGIRDKFGDHDSSCSTSQKNVEKRTRRNGSAPKYERHTSLKAAIIDEAHRGGMSVSDTEPVALIKGEPLLRPADILFPHLFGSHDLAVDVTVVDSFGPFSNGSLVPSKVLKDAADRKYTMYLDKCNKNGLVFKPFVMGSHGGFGTDCDFLVKKIAAAQSNSGRYGYSVAQLSNFIYQRLSFEVQKVQANFISERQPFVYGGDEGFELDSL
jgi:hypothetical protein